MIISRTPFRLSFVGGGSDLPSYYRRNGGSVISMAIDKFIYVSVNKSFSDSVRVAYSKVEECQTFSEVEHPLVRSMAKTLGLETGLEITSVADIPASGSGLGSSSAFTVGLLNACSSYKGEILSKTELAERACCIEIDMCGQPIGKQDQYAASIGGINVLNFKTNDSVEIDTLSITPFYQKLFMDSLLVFYTGGTRKASEVLSEQNQHNLTGLNDRLLNQMASLVPDFRKSMEIGDIQSCGEIFDLNWQLKKGLSRNITNSFIDEIYDVGKNHGAIGGKLLGAGSTGFMVFIAPNHKHSTIVKKLNKLSQHFWTVNHSGTSIIYQS